MRGCCCNEHVRRNQSEGQSGRPTRQARRCGPPVVTHILREPYRQCYVKQAENGGLARYSPCAFTMPPTRSDCLQILRRPLVGVVTRAARETRRRNPTKKCIGAISLASRIRFDRLVAREGGLAREVVGILCRPCRRDRLNRILVGWKFFKTSSSLGLGLAFWRQHVVGLHVENVAPRIRHVVNPEHQNFRARGRLFCRRLLRQSSDRASDRQREY